MTGALRVLYYNWVDYLDDENRGGGVTIYQRNLMAQMAERDGVEAVFLSAGLSHDVRPGPPRWEAVRHGPRADRDRRFEIVNSGVLSPSHHSFGDPAQVEHAPTEAAFFDFLAATGPYDVIHFNNLEGLPARVLTLKDRCPGTRVILSMHNYYPVCPQVNLWFQERQTCVDFEGGRNCATCLADVHNRSLLRTANGMAYRLKRMGVRPGSWAYDVGFKWGLRAGGNGLRLLKRALRRGGKPSVTEPHNPASNPGSGFAHRRQSMIDLINTHVDRVLCVSDAVGRVVESYGVDPALTATSYIGTREADAWARTAPGAPAPAEDQTLTLAYLGYMRRDKGFYFLLDALEALPDAIAARLRLRVAARTGEAATMARLDALRPRLAELTHLDGYTHAGLDDLLAGVHAGLIPVLWHDNLPQVAIEMHARHIPLLTSDMGGAQELGGTDALRFVAGDVAALQDRIIALMDGQVDLDAYWANARPPVDMAAHVDDLMRHYAPD